MRQCASYEVSNTPELRSKLLNWASGFNTLTWLDSNNYPDHKYHFYDFLLAVGARKVLSAQAGTAFDQLKQLQTKTGDWLFGYLGYDLKNEVEALKSANFDGLEFPDLLFFQPEIVLYYKDGQLHIESLTDEPQTVWATISTSEPVKHHAGPNISLTSRIDKDTYLKRIETLRGHIAAGDVYEINFCQEYYAEDVEADLFDLYQQLNDITHAPFSALFKHGNVQAISASPERFLAKRGNKLISQPIKGTRRRDIDPVHDEALKAELQADIKERAENVMIVDLVRNDLTRSCQPGTIEVEELFGVYTFETVHHLISTVTGTLPNDVHPVDAIKNAFPMGSMTGAPKVRVMELTEDYEATKRGLYSGAIGYFAPKGDLDLNVVIRTILYNSNNRYLSCQVGGAITWHSDAEKEFEECELKVAALKHVLSGH